MLDADACYRALAARDPRFDGVFFVGVQTTGIYCRSVCPARQPRRDRCTFYRSAAEAEGAGFRACFRCRPELAPGVAAVDAPGRLAQAAARHIADGFLDQHGVTELADALGVSDRHLRRVLSEHLGATPSALAQTRRLAIAKRLLQDTALPIIDVALLSGFGSVRRFNAVFAQVFDRPPSAVRRGPASGDLTLRLDFRPPIEWAALLGFLDTRAMPGIEWIDGDAWVRQVHLSGLQGRICARLKGDRVVVQVPVQLAPLLPTLVRRLRRTFDLDARPHAIAQGLGDDPRLAVAAAPGLRVPGAFDGFELAVRTILGQQVSVTGANTLAGRLVERFGRPEPHLLAALDADTLRTIGLPGARAQTLIDLAIAWPTLRPVRAPEDVVNDLLALRGVGPWTANYLAMRWLKWPDAFPGGDLVIRRALGVKTPTQAVRAAAHWTPWRAYAAMHLWRNA
jgi:AraC family transcriptional regulator of adaptative response / DNA-3-methyladenine glycosylase II